MITSNLLSPEEIHAYGRDGYLAPKFKLSEADIDKLQRITLRLVADNPQARAAIRRPHLVARTGSHGFDKQADWLHIAANPRILDMIENLIGPDIILWTSTIFYKAPLETGTPWHRDQCPFLKQTDVDEIITVWIAVFDVRKEDGALRLIPQSHLRQPTGVPSTQDSQANGRVCLNASEEETAVNAELEAGQMILFDASTVHGSWPNFSSRERYGYSVRFFRATSRFDRSSELALARSRELILVRGDDRAGNISYPKASTEQPIVN